MIIYAPRASSILFNYLKAQKGTGYWLLPVNVCPIVPITFMKAGVSFEFVDINMDDYCIDYASVLEHLGFESCKGLLFVYTYGVEIDRTSFFSELKKLRPSFAIIEDKCLCKPSFSTECVSDHSDFALYSTGYSKYCDLGYGGFAVAKTPMKYILTTLSYSSEDLKFVESEYKKALSEKGQFSSGANSDWLDNDVFKLEISDYEAAVNQNLSKISEHKIRINRIYEKGLPDHIKLKVGELSPTNWRYNITVDDKDSLLDKIFKNESFASSHYQPLEGVFSKQAGKNDNASRLHDRVVNLFNDFHFTEEMARSTCEIINNHLN